MTSFPPGLPFKVSRTKLTLKRWRNGLKTGPLCVIANFQKSQSNSTDKSPWKFQKNLNQFTAGNVFLPIQVTIARRFSYSAFHRRAPCRAPLRAGPLFWKRKAKRARTGLLFWTKQFTPKITMKQHLEIRVESKFGAKSILTPKSKSEFCRCIAWLKKNKRTYSYMLHLPATLGF